MKEIINLKTLKIQEDVLTPRQKEFLHLVDARFFENGFNPYQKENQNWTYKTPLFLEKDLFYLHLLLDPKVLEVGAVRRFPQQVNRNYIAEKFFDDKWVSEGNNSLALALSKYIQTNLSYLKSKNKIKLLDIGPCGGAITTLFALKALDKFNLLEKTEVYLLDIVPEVLKVTKAGDFSIPQKMIEEFELNFAGKNGKLYKQLMQGSKVIPIVGDGESLPDQIKDMDISLAGYVHHHMNLHARKKLAEQTEQATIQGGFIGVVDFYVKSFTEYMNWYKPHFQKYKTPPPVECPRISGTELANWYNQTKIFEIDETLENSFVFSGTKI